MAFDPKRLISIGVPTRGAIDYLVAKMLLDLQFALLDRRPALFTFEGLATVVAARDAIAQRALDAGADLLFIDDDVFIEPPLILALLDRAARAGGRDLHAITYRRRKVDFDTRDEDMPGGAYTVRPLPDSPIVEGMTEVESVGFGCVHVPHALLVAMAARYADLAYVAPWSGQRVPGLFRETYASDGMLVPEDASFCARARACGSRIWVVVDAASRHVGRVEQRGNFAHDVRGRAVCVCGSGRAFAQCHGGPS
jgi:hypothetical protein